CAALVMGVTFNRPGNPLRFAYDHTGRWSPISSGSNMLAAGYVGGFLAEMPMTPMRVPAGYDKEVMQGIQDRYVEDARKRNINVEPDLRPNIVTILAESVADPVGLEGVRLAEDPLRAMRDLNATPVHGRTKTFAFGTGTS